MFQIRIDRETSKRMKEIILIEFEDYDEIINRLIDFYDKNKSED